MDEYRRLRREVAVPSCAALLFIVSSITLTYGISFGIREEAVLGAVILAAAVIYAVRLMMTRRGNRARKLILCCVLPAVLAAIPALLIRGQADTALSKGPYRGKVAEQSLFRYNREAVIAVPPAGGGAPALVSARLPLSAELREGDLIEFQREPRPIVTAGPDDYATGLRRRGIRYSVTLGDNDFTVPARTAPAPQGPLRSNLESRIDLLFSNGTAALLKGLYFGNKDYIGKDVVHAFTRAGVLHILAASGSHLTTMALIPVLILGLLRTGRRTVFVLSVAFLAGYLCITDVPVSLQRAFLMFCIAGMHLLLDYDRNTLNALFLSGLAILAIHPWELYSLGFQLSFGATLGIIIFFKRYRDSLARLPAFLRGPLALTLSAQSLVFPVLAFRLGEINLIAIASNLVIIPLVEVAFAGSAGILLLHSIAPGAAKLLALAVDASGAATFRCAFFFASLPGHLSVDSLTPLLALPYLLYLAPLVPSASLKRYAWLCVPAALLLTFFMYAPVLPGRGGIAVLDTPRSAAALTITGGEALVAGRIGSIGDASLLVRRINNSEARTATLYLTGLDYRNIGAAAYLARKLPLRSCVIMGDYGYGNYLRRLMDVLDRDGIAPVLDCGNDRRNGGALTGEGAASLLVSILGKGGKKIAGSGVVRIGAKKP